MVIADMPFGSYRGLDGPGRENVCKMVKLSRCDCVKIETGPVNLPLVRRLADAGVAVMRTWAFGRRRWGTGRISVSGATADTDELINLAQRAEAHGAAACCWRPCRRKRRRGGQRTRLPVIRCGAGPACHGHVVVMHDAGTDRSAAAVCAEASESGRPGDRGVCGISEGECANKNIRRISIYMRCRPASAKNFCAGMNPGHPSGPRICTRFDASISLVHDGPRMQEHVVERNPLGNRRPQLSL